MRRRKKESKETVKVTNRKFGDVVEFVIKRKGREYTLCGKVETVYAKGSVFNPRDETVYDICVEHSPLSKDKCLYQRVPEKAIRRVYE